MTVKTVKAIETVVTAVIDETMVHSQWQAFLVILYIVHPFYNGYSMRAL